jgi:hypothetical protein
MNDIVNIPESPLDDAVLRQIVYVYFFNDDHFTKTIFRGPKTGRAALCVAMHCDNIVKGLLTTSGRIEHYGGFDGAKLAVMKVYNSLMKAAKALVDDPFSFNLVCKLPAGERRNCRGQFRKSSGGNLLKSFKLRIPSS